MLLLPELVHKRWMFHSIGRTLKKLLHPGNGLKTRKDGMRLFIIWYQILQENASDECHQIFLQLVPGLGEGINQDMLIGKQPAASDSCSGMIAAGEILPILPASGEKYPDNITRHFFNELLHYIVTEVVKVEWLNKDMREASFVFLFNKFKTTYLDWILPDFDHSSNIYEPILEMPKIRTLLDMKTKDIPANVSECRDSYIRWLAHFVTLSKKREQPDKEDVMLQGTTEEDDVHVKEVQESKIIDPGEHMPGSNTSTLSTASRSSEHDSPNSSLCYDGTEDENEIVKNVLYSTRENVNIVHESFRQALLFSFNHAKAIKTVIGVYRDWFQHVDQKPIFMQEPCEGLHIGHRETPEYYHSLSDIVEEEGSSDESAPCSVAKQLLTLENLDDKSGIRNASYLGAIHDLADGGECCKNDIRAGVQKVLQVFITNAANIFLLEAEDDGMLNEQVELCKRVLNIYRYLVMNMKLEQKTWEKMLEVLLCITSGVLQAVPPENKMKTLGGKLAQPIFQTLIVTWIKANLNVFISLDLWNQFLKVLSSLTSWPELVREWAKTMETLTRVLARQVYNLDLHDLPLDRLSEQKEKRRRGRSQDMTKNKINDRSFSKGWSKNEPQGAVTEKTPSAMHIPFERGKYKSDGAGGTKSRPDLSKQRSLSGEPSPSHSRTPSNASDSALYVRSSSEGNLSEELVERLKGAVSSNNNGPEDQEVAEITTTSVDSSMNRSSLDSCTLLSDPFMEQSADNISLEKSEQESTLKYSRTPSPASLHSRTPSPTSELTVDTSNHHKHCPTPDQDSLHIEMDTTSDEVTMCKESLEDMKSVLSGGSVQGWMPDVAVVLWRRMLGSLGNINKVEDAENHATVHEELSYLLETLNKMRSNLGVTADNMNSPPPPELIPPLHIFAPWLFECLSLPDKFKRGKLLAYQLLCQMVVQRHTVPLPSELVSQFYLALHQGVNSGDQDVINVLVKYCGAKFFSVGLPGSTLLIQKFVDAVAAVITNGDIKESPRKEGLSILGSLVCHPNHFMEVQVLDTSTLTVSNLHCDHLKEEIINNLLKAGKKEPAGLARCVAVSSIGIFLYEELMHETLHPKLNEAVLVLLGSLRCMYKMVAKNASDMLQLLCDHSEKLLSYHPELPKRIIEVIASTVLTLIPTVDSLVSEEEKKLIISMMFCMVEWCTKMPVGLLLETTDTDKGCLYKVFHVLDIAVKGHTSDSLSQAKQSLSGMLQDSDFEHLRDLSNIPRKQSSDSLSSFTAQTEKNDNKSPRETNSVQIAARTLICHLVNHLCHFPMGAGASRLNTTIQEYQDFDDLVFDDLKSDIYCMPNVQFFVLNKRTLVSFIELTALLDVPGGGVTAGLTTAKTVCRVLLRDLTGKYSWESSVLYAPPWCLQGSSIKNAKYLLGLTTESELEPLIINEETDVTPPRVVPERSCTEIPHFESTVEGQDNLNDMLKYIGATSPECLLIPGVQLNVEAPVPEGLSEHCEGTMTESVLQQKQAEINYYNKHKSDASMLAKPQIPTEIEEPLSPFQICRMLIDQMGFLAWEKRCQFDLLKKTDKLLRELKNLDNQKCRETHKFAVIYVAEGQEDKNTILSNTGGSKAFEDFVSGLGWEVELETHQGFLGGLQQNKTTGDSAPYYANSLCECIFHVSTRMPSGTDEARHNIKIKHLGNDEVHIVWSEHTREYRRDIIPTEFGDVLIIIYPLSNGLYRIQIQRKPEVPYFGPLFDGAILDRKVLPGLVRATAINASRVKRSLMPFYHSFYEERAKCFDTIIEQHVEKNTFEEFSANVFAPVLPPNSTISDNSIEIPPSSSSSSLEQSIQSLEQVSPPSGRQSRGNDSFGRTYRRLSLKSKKSSSKISQQIVTPPLSPSLKYKKS
ncbi:hypothetical protein KUTeg_012903 [Tegillarca granosa]|uniref:Rap-GAP domain-containing protein n=1 Tax=Tegillarca granosa TaxID=220873 RepID=A0ABQ9ES35_TEGGR|nr:hypothetical protein KUTeg_012903 [Tegillarca granosa]